MCYGLKDGFLCEICASIFVTFANKVSKYLSTQQSKNLLRDTFFSLFSNFVKLYITFTLSRFVVKYYTHRRRRKFVTWYYGFRSSFWQNLNWAWRSNFSAFPESVSFEASLGGTISHVLRFFRFIFRLQKSNFFFLLMIFD